MTYLIRLLLGVAWIAGIAWLWHADMLRPLSAVLAGAAGLVLVAWPTGNARRRRSAALQYVEMSKQPLGLP